MGTTTREDRPEDIQLAPFDRFWPTNHHRYVHVEEVAYTVQNRVKEVPNVVETTGKGYVSVRAVESTENKEFTPAVPLGANPGSVICGDWQLQLVRRATLWLSLPKTLEHRAAGF